MIGGVVVPSTAVAYRTATDLPELRGATHVRFAEDRIPFRLNDDFPAELVPDFAQQAVINAAAKWREPACSSLSFVYEGLTTEPAVPGDGVNTVEWLGDWSARGLSAAAAGVTDVIYEEIDGEFRIVEADVYLNSEFTWSLSAGHGREVEAVMVHEFGHVLGLLHPCEIERTPGAPLCTSADEALGATMHPAYSDGQVTLTEDDVAGLCALYPAPDCRDTGCPDQMLCTSSGCQPDCLGEACAAGETCGAEGCQTACDEEPCAACRTDADCPSGAACEALDENAGVCVARAAVLGDPCEVEADCAGGVCVEGDGAPYCSRVCAVAADCGGGWTCGTVDGENVCLPLEAGGACSVTSLAPGSGRWLLVSLLVMATSVLRKRSRAWGSRKARS